MRKKESPLDAENERLRATNAHLMAKAAERDDLININAELLAALEKFRAHYPHGINPDLDEAHGMAIDAIAKAKETT